MGHCVYIIVEFLKTEDNFYGKWGDFERGMIKYNKDNLYDGDSPTPKIVLNF